jgi:hypothetical protein
MILNDLRVSQLENEVRVVKVIYLEVDASYLYYIGLSIW